MEIVQTPEIDQLRQAYHDAFTQLGSTLYLIIGAMVLLAVIVCWSLIWSSDKVKPAKPFDPEFERREPKRWRM